MDERANFFRLGGKTLIFEKYAYIIDVILVSRAPGKRQVKPTAAIFEEAAIDDDDDDEDFTGEFLLVLLLLQILGI